MDFSALIEDMNWIKKELQVLAGLEIQNRNDKNCLSDIQAIARRVKASCSSMQHKLNTLEKEMMEQKKKNDTLSRQLQEANDLNKKIQCELEESKSFLDECLDESFDFGEKKELAEENTAPTGHV